MKISGQGIALIKSFEGCRLAAYKAVSTEKYYTIGWGHYGADVKAGQTISQNEADALLISDLRQFEKYTNHYTASLELNQNQFDALVSFCYNCGPGTLKKLVAGRTPEEIAEHITDQNYTKSGGKVLKALERRRKTEKELFCKGVGTVKITIGSARIDENGKISGGAAGDQTGKEVSTQDYYTHSKGWYLFRPKSAADADRLAASMSAACLNDLIGYDQGNRLDVITQIKKYGSMEKIAVKTEADCGTLVRGCCIEAGFDPGNFTTANEAAALARTGKFEDKVPVTTSTVLYNGDILVTKTKGHTVIVVEGNPRKGDTAQGIKIAFIVGHNYTLQNNMYVRDAAGGNKKPYLQLTTNAKSHAITDTGGYGILKKGTVVTCKGTEEKDGAIWMKIPSGCVCAVGASGKVYIR